MTLCLPRPIDIPGWMNPPLISFTVLDRELNPKCHCQWVLGRELNPRCQCQRVLDRELNPQCHCLRVLDGEPNHLFTSQRIFNREPNPWCQFQFSFKQGSEPSFKAGPSFTSERSSGRELNPSSLRQIWIRAPNLFLHSQWALTRTLISSHPGICKGKFITPSYHNTTPLAFQDAEMGCLQFKVQHQIHEILVSFAAL